MTAIETEILVVGGGAAGLSAALAASAERNARITLTDDNPLLGGQLWRAELGKIRSPKARELIEKVRSKRINIINNTRIWGKDGPSGLLADSPNGPLYFDFDHLILATGARERFLPFPGWTLPGVFGAGGLQAMVKGGFSVAGKRVVVSGTGPLLLAVAASLKNKGAKIVLISEQASAAKIAAFALGLWLSPSKAAGAAALRSKLLGIPYWTDSWVTSAARSSNSNDIGSVTVSRKGKTSEIKCDLLAFGFHLVPNVELAALLGCKLEGSFVQVDDFQRTSCENIYCAGEPTGIGGVEAARVEGEIAGLNAAGMSDRAKPWFGRRNKTGKFAKQLERAFVLRPELKAMAEDDTIVCRCEDVRYGQLKQHGSWRSAKLQTRCGMGACQGRVCSAATEFLFGWKIDSMRPPLYPVNLENL